VLSNGVGPWSRFVRTAVTTGVPFGLVMGLLYFLMMSFLFGFSSQLLAFGVVQGAGCGALFGVCMGAFVSYQGRKFASENPCAPGEDLIRHGVANHFLRLEGAGGYLYLTTERLLFRSHKFNVRDHELSIPLKDVVSVRPFLTAGLIPNGLEVVRAGRRERFAVEDRHGWADEIRRATEQSAPQIV
jgi:hypothetical protein